MKSGKGFTLILSAVTALIVFILAESLFASLTGHINLIAGQNDNIRAYDMAEAGLARGIIQLRSAIPPTPLNTYPIAATPLANGTYEVNFTDTTLPGELPSFRITSIGICGNARRTLNLEVFQKSFAQWVSFSGTEAPSPGSYHRFYTGEIIGGPVHTNDQIYIGGTPIFKERVTSVNSTWMGWSDMYGTPANPDFQKGFYGGMPGVTIPSAVEVLSPIEAAAAVAGAGLSLTGDTTIVLNASGDMTVTNNSTTQTVALPANNAIYINGGDLNISGTLNGKVTIGAGKTSGIGGNIFIMGNLTYAGARDPVTLLPTDPNNMLALVAGGNVSIDRYASGYRQPLEIDAYIVAPEGAFLFGGQNTNQWWRTEVRGDLTLYGGVAHHHVGSLSMLESDNGYKRRYYHDERFKTGSPLHFAPLRDAGGRIVYAKKLWQGR